LGYRIENYPLGSKANFIALTTCFDELLLIDLSLECIEDEAFKPDEAL